MHSIPNKLGLLQSNDKLSTTYGSKSGSKTHTPTVNLPFPLGTSCYLDFISLNVRSLISISSRTKLDAFTKLVQPNVLLLQETWHMDHSPALIENYYTFITPPSKKRNHGNMILVKKIFRHVHPIFTKLWTTKQVAVLIHVTNTIQLAVVSVYTDAMAIVSSDKDLQYLCKNIRQQYPAATLLVGGDLNRSSDDVVTLAKSINLTKATHALDDYTRKQKGSPNAVLDYFLVSQPVRQTTIPTLNPDLSDHIPINCQITINM